MKTVLLIIVSISLVMTMTSCVIKDNQNLQSTTTGGSMPTLQLDTEPISPATSDASVILEDVQLIEEVPLPLPESGDWYEWDKAGRYPANPDFEGSLYYISAQDLLLRSYDEDGEIIVSRLNGAEGKILDSGILGSFNVNNGWIYYLKSDGVWKVRINGNENCRIFERDVEPVRNHLFVYNDVIYIIKEYERFLECIDMDGKNHRTLDIYDMPMGYYFFADGYMYYGADSIDKDPLGDTWDIWRYKIDTKKAEKLVSEIFGTLIVRDGMVYYVYDNLYRTNVERVDTIISDRSRSWNYNYNLYRNYLLYIKTEDEYGAYNNGLLCAFNIHTGQEYSLFYISESNMKIYVTENCVFLYSGYRQDSIYQITFVNDKAQLWKLNSISEP